MPCLGPELILAVSVAASVAQVIVAATTEPPKPPKIGGGDEIEEARRRALQNAARTRGRRALIAGGTAETDPLQVQRPAILGGQAGLRPGTAGGPGGPQPNLGA